jgi:hypothetical protein
VATASPSRPSIHGVEPSSGSLFWALEEDGDSDSENETESISWPELRQEGFKAAGFTPADIERELRMAPSCWADLWLHANSSNLVP